MSKLDTQQERLNPDLPPWERQPDETDRAYVAFKAWLDSDKRRVVDHGPTAANWSSRWQWSARAREYDVYMARVDLEDQVRYRRKMNDRHRRMASVALSKVVEWLGSVDPTRMSTADATRLLDVAVRIERDATGIHTEDDLPPPHPEIPHEGSLEQRLIDAGLDVEMSDVARLLHERLGTEPEPASEPPPPPRRPAPVAEDVPAPAVPAALLTNEERTARYGTAWW
jgi:hypothetical protein